MNAIVPAAPNNDEILRVLENSLYPGARRESIELVMSYCRVHGIDPLLRPVHIVPTSVKVGDNKYEMRDVLMPGIADYRIKAARSGNYGGKSEPEFGPTRSETLGNVRVTFPEWCRVTVYRVVAGQPRAFAAKELWMENYATAGRNTEAPNAMWRKRAYGQLAKCAEAQALRMAFPEFSGGVVTAEEMEGKEFAGPTIEGEASSPPASEARERINAEVPISQQPGVEMLATDRWIDQFERQCNEAENIEQAEALLRKQSVLRIDDEDARFTAGQRERARAIRAAMIERLYPKEPEDEPDLDDMVGAPTAPTTDEPAEQAAA